MHKSLNVDIACSPYKALIGVGGIGTGTFFALNGDHTLGREESRSGHFLDRRDYCKLHIIAHYVGTLLGPSFFTLPIGRVGNDSAGLRLVEEMKLAGLDSRFVEVVDGGQTLFSFCFVYPDGSGGNLTTDNSVNATVDAAFVSAAEPAFQHNARHGVALAAPESSLDARIRLLELATEYGFLRVASLTSEEIQTPSGKAIIAMTDVLALNRDEAAVLTGMASEADDPTIIVTSAIDVLRRMQPKIRVMLTAGADGSWFWDGAALHHAPAMQVVVVNSAGAGDAHLGGLIAGIACGLTPSDTLLLGVLVAALSVTSPHTIHPTLDRTLIGQFAREHEIALSDPLRRLLTEPISAT